MNGMSKLAEQAGPKLIDDFLRRELRIADPRNPTELVRALQRRYPGPASRIEQEAAGMPVRFDAVPLLPDAVVPARDTPGSREAQRVQDNLEKDLTGLIDGPGNRDWRVELTGWRNTLLREYGDGMAAARFARDPAQRERAFLAVRRLGEYARLARLIGVMNLPMNAEYRRLAMTLDDSATVLRILMGEALYEGGLADGGLMIQVPLTDLRARRDVLILGVRRLSGLEEDTDDDWGDALAAYRALLAALEAQGAPELRVYLREELLAPILDGLVSSVARQDPEALRQVAATAPVEIARMRRLLQITNDLVATMPPPPNPLAAALSYFLQALQLFVDTFLEIRSGARLIDLAVPLPMAAQQSREADGAGRTILRDVVSRRADYAREVECYLSCCGGGVEELRCQVKLDKVLYDVDRAIDLYAQGSGVPPTWGGEEKRAGAYGVIARNMANDQLCVSAGSVYPVLAAAARAGIGMVAAAADLATVAGDAGLRQDTDAVEQALSAVLAAADALYASRPLGEGILRQLTAPSLPVLTGIETQVDDLVTAARSGPAGVEAAIQLAVNVAETAAGDSGVPSISTVEPLGAVALPTIDISLTDPPEAAPAIAAAGEAIAAALVVAGEQTQANRDAANDAATTAETRSREAEAAALIVLDPLRRGALGSAAGAAAAAAAAARSAASLEVPGIETVDLWRSLDRLGTLLQTALPPPGDAEREPLLTAVFEEQLRAEGDWALLVGSLAPRCLGPGRADLVTAGRELLHGSHPDFRNRRLRPIVVAPPPPPERITLMQTATGVTRLARRADEFAQVVEGALAVVPVLVNRDRERAKQLLAAAKLALGTVTEELSPRPPGTVLHQDPPTGRTVRAGTAINLRVAIGVTVPNVVDAMLSEATEILEGVGLVVGDVTKEPSAKNAEKVLSQRPFAGQTASLGSRVNLVIATGIPVPELLGLNQSQAATALQQVLLKLGTVSAGAGEGTPGTIIEQYPEAGDLAALETEVNVTVVATSVSGPHREAAGSGSRALAADVAGRLGPLLDLADTALREVGGVERLRAKRNVWQGYEASLRTAWDEASAARAAVERAGGDYAASRFEELVAPMPEDAEADFFETKRQRLAECRDVLSRYSPRGE